MIERRKTLPPRQVRLSASGTSGGYHPLLLWSLVIAAVGLIGWMWWHHHQKPRPKNVARQTDAPVAKSSKPRESSSPAKVPGDKPKPLPDNAPRQVSREQSAVITKPARAGAENRPPGNVPSPE